MIGTLHALRCAGPSDCSCDSLRVRIVPTRSRARGYNGEYTREVVANVESRTAGLSHFPEQAGRLRDHDGEAS